MFKSKCACVLQNNKQIGNETIVSEEWAKQKQQQQTNKTAYKEYFY